MKSLSKNVTFKPLNADLKNVTPKVSKGDTYCIIIHNSNKFISKICKDGGKNPTWSDCFDAKMASPSDDSFRIQLWDRDHLSRDEFIGEGTFNLPTTPGNTIYWVELQRDGKHTGNVLVSTEIHSCESLSQFNEMFVRTSRQLGYIKDEIY